jgi:multidrug efflux pump subunit AcrB
MSITDFALNNSRTVILSMIFIIFAGLYLYTDFPKLEDPSIIIREAVVAAQYPGMPTERVERLITRPIEEQLRSMGEVDEIRSTSKPGSTIIHVTIKDEVPSNDLPDLWKHLRNKMHDVVPELPTGTIGPIVNDEFGDTAVAIVALWSDGFSLADMHEVARDTRERLAILKGLKKIELYGVQDERIFLELSNSKLSQFGISPRTIRQALEKQNVILPGGRVNVGGIEYIIEPTGNFNQVSEINSILIPIPGTEKVIPLQDLAIIKRGYVDPPEKPAYFNGKQAIVLSFILLPGVNAVSFGGILTEKLHELEQSLPLGYNFDYATYQPDLINASVNGMVINVIETIVIVLVVVMLFLGIRIGLIVGSFVPLVMLLGIVVMSLYDIEMQRMSLASMIIALGMLVDNGIVVAEDIKSRMEIGTPRKEAVLLAGRTLSLPLLTSTLTTVFAFAPMLLTEGSTGDYTRSLGQVVSILLLGSWFLSMYATTSSSYWFMKVKPLASTGEGPADPYQGKVYRVYKGLLKGLLRVRSLVILAIIGALFVAGYGFKFVDKTFFPPGDRNQYLIYLDFPAGTRIEETDRTIRAISLWLQDKKVNSEITGTVAYVGNGGPRFFLSLSPDDPDANYGFIIVNTETNLQVPELVERTREHLLTHFPNVRGRVKAMWLGSTETGMLEIRLSGPNIAVLREQAAVLEGALKAIPGSLDVRQDWNNLVNKVIVNVDQERARRAGITSQEVADTLDAFIDGTTISDYRSDDTVIPIVARGLESERTNPVDLASIGIYSHKNKTSVPLSQIADSYTVGELSKLKRYYQERTITVSGKHQVMTAIELFNTLKPTLDSLNFPPGHWWEMGGELEESAKAQKKLGKWMLPCFGFIVVLLVWQFNSFRRATIILITIPLVFIGVVIGLFVMKASFGFMVILGLLSLAGTIINNGIVLIDKIESLRQEGSAVYNAIVDACVSRLRPIFMSVTTTVLGFLPLILSKDPLFYGMAVAMAFGLLIGTVFTLGFVPVMYSLFFRVKIPKSA